MKKSILLLFLSMSVIFVNAQQSKSQVLKDLRLSVNASFLPSETVNSFGGSAYIVYKKLLVGYTYLSGATGRRETRSGNILTVTRTYSEFNSGSIGYEVTEDLFLKGGYGAYNIRGRVDVVNLGVSSNGSTFNVPTETLSFGMLYMNTPYHFNFGVDFVGASDPLMLFSLGFNL